MSVLFETSLGDIVVDLETELCPKTSENFLKLCKTYYYNFCALFNVQKNFIAQTGDPTDTGTGGQSIFPARYFAPEIRTPTLKHTSRGTLSMAVADGRCASQFFFTLADGLDYLDGKQAVFGRVVEGWETLDAINDAMVDEEGRPLRDIRLRHVIVLDDPFPDPPGLVVPPHSPVPTAKQLASLRVGDEEDLQADADPETVEAARREREARAQALTLEMVGDLPFADVAPPENVLFVCKLNAVTRSEDLELIFSRFGTILSCEVIKDKKTGDSLQYAFVEFEEREAAERAYFKMDNVLIDDRRIHVDFSQSVSKLHDNWVYQRTGGRPPPNKGKSNGKPAFQDDDEPRERKGKMSYSHGASHRPSNDRYSMTFDESDLRDRHRDRDRRRSRSPRRYDDRKRDERRDGGRDRRERSRSPRRRDERDRDRDRDRDREYRRR